MNNSYTIKLFCACNGLPCSGICRDLHLYRKREKLDICPAAYDPEKEPKRVREIRMKRETGRGFTPRRERTIISRAYFEEY